MKRNPVVPYILIMVIGIALVFFLSVKGLGDAKEMAKDKKEGGAKTEQAKFEPEAFAMSTCISCHGENLKGAMGPNLHGIGKQLSKDKIKDVLTNGTDGGMPGGLITNPADIDAMAEWVSNLK